MERRHFLKLTFGFVAGATAFAASAKAAPLPPVSPQHDLVLPHGEGAEAAVISQDEVDHLAPEEVRWGRRGHGHWGHRRHGGWHRRHWGWRRRHWGWHRWHRRRWHRRHWGWHRHWRRHRW